MTPGSELYPIAEHLLTELGVFAHVPARQRRPVLIVLNLTFRVELHALVHSLNLQGVVVRTDAQLFIVITRAVKQELVVVLECLRFHLALQVLYGVRVEPTFTHLHLRF